MTEHHLFLAQQQVWDLTWDGFRLAPSDHPWLAVPGLRVALVTQQAVLWAAAVRRALAMREAGWLC